MIKILVTGANGQLGQSFQYWAPDFVDFKFFFYDLPELNLLDHKQLEYFFQSTTIDVVINCAAFTAVDQAEDHPDVAEKLNSVAIDALCKLSKNFGFRLIHFSTDYVFDGKSYEPYKESDYLSPIGVYGQTKAKGEAVMLLSLIHI